MSLKDYQRVLEPEERKLLLITLYGLERVQRGFLITLCAAAGCAVLLVPAITVWVWNAGGAALGLLVLLAGEAIAGMIFRKALQNYQRERNRTRPLLAILESGRIEVVRCTSEKVVILDPLPGRKPAYVFQVEEDEIFCVGDDRDYEGLSQLPNSDFEIVRIPTQAPKIRCLGQKLEPLRRVPADLHKDWSGFSDGDVHEGRLSEIEGVPSRS